MSGSAKVTSIDAIEAFRIALLKFQDQSARSLMSIDEQTKRVMHWFEHEAPVEWNMRIRHCYDEVARTRTALETCRMRKVGDNRPACIEEKEAYRAAQRKLSQAQEMLDVIRIWANRVRQATDDYRGGVMGLRSSLEVAVPETLAMLSRTVRALEAYAETSREEPEALQVPPADQKQKEFPA